MKLAFLLLIPALVCGQQWTGVLDSSRAIDWSGAGVSGGIPTRTSICSTLSAGATAAQINSAIQNCATNGVVKLNAGTFNLGACINFTGKSNVTLRGSGPTQTILNFTGGGCGSAPSGGADIMIENASQINPTNPTYVVNWTAGYTKGTTSITLSSKTGLFVGSIIGLDQLNDSNTDNGGLWVCANGPYDSIPGTPYCSIEGDSGLSRSDMRVQAQMVTVTSISGGSCPCTIGISPGLHMPNWSGSKTPQAWWVADIVSGVGVEDMTVDHINSSAPFGIAFTQARDSWVKNVKSLRSNRGHILGYGGTTRITIRDSYVYGTQSATSQSYGIETDLSSDWLVENNISERVVSFHSLGEAAQGHVYSYNYSLDDYYCDWSGNPTTWMQASSYHHTAGIAFTLFEGNVGIGFTADAIHGTAHFMTGFRNRWQGYDPAGCSVSGKTVQSIPIHVYTFNRFFNLVGNVLGDTRRPHTAYEGYAASASDAGPNANADVAIYMLGYSGNQEKNADVANDTLVRSTMMRWGNWDTVNTASRFVSGEVPSGLGVYANPVPASNDLPSSFYLAARPSSWWRVGSTTPKWPPIGPDVTGGSISNVGGKADKIPAQLCYETTSTTGGIKNFDAAACYADAGGTTVEKSVTGVVRVSGAVK